jgi:sporulation protein YlmC with PRC-barrel domain
MMRSMQELERYRVAGTDGEVGNVSNFLLDDSSWKVRYLVVRTPGTAPGRREVLIAPGAFRQAEGPTERLHLSLSRERIRAGQASEVDTISVKEVRGFQVEGRDGVLGHVEDALLDDETWTVRYLVIDTSPWWLGKRALVSPQWATRINWPDRRFYLGVPRLAVQAAPEFSRDAPIDRAYEAELHHRHGRAGYWEPPRPTREA